MKTDIPLVWMEVDVEKLRRNINMIREKIGYDRKLMGVVKSNAYGLGSITISSFLLANGADELAVANYEEALYLRLSGIHAPILILGVTLLEHAFSIIEHNLTPSVWTIPVVEVLNDIGSKRKEKIKVHIRLDLGLGNLGVLPKEALTFIEKVTMFPWIEIEGLYTQLASTYEENVTEIEKDMEFIQSLIAAITDKGIKIPKIHVASSAAILTLPESYFDMVRPGIILYGMPVLKNTRDLNIKPIMQLKAKVVDIKAINKGTLIGGYGSRKEMQIDTVIATVPLGYADGQFLFHYKGGDVLIHGQRVPIIGTPYMEYILIDVTKVPNVKIGDEVVVLGEQQLEAILPEEIAVKSKIGVMNCDCITLLSNRIPRVYINSEQAVTEAIESVYI